MDYVLSIENNNLIVYKKHNNILIGTFVCKQCIFPKTKKTKRLLYAIKKEHDMTIKIIPCDETKLEIHIGHPLYDYDIYVLYDINISIKQLPYIYILELEQNKYYIGKSINPISRASDHVTIIDNTSAGSSWTYMYKPTKIIDIFRSSDEFDEDINTLKYMRMYGIDNVRGGSFCELNLLQHNILTLEKMLAGSDDKCYYCGKTDHFINTCPQKNVKRIAKKHIKSKYDAKSKIVKFFSATKLLDNSNISITNNGVYHCQYCNKKFNTSQNKITHENILCQQNEKVIKQYRIDANVDAVLNSYK